MSGKFADEIILMAYHKRHLCFKSIFFKSKWINKGGLCYLIILFVRKGHLSIVY